MGEIIDLAAARRRRAERERRRRTAESERTRPPGGETGASGDLDGDGANRDPERSPTR
jgi:hypothetical protein